MPLLNRVRLLEPRTRRIALAASFLVTAAAALVLVAWPHATDVRLLWTAPDRLAAVWGCTGRSGWPLLAVDAALAFGFASFLLLLIADRPDHVGATIATAIAWFVVAAGVVQLIRDLCVAGALLHPQLATSLLPFFAFVGWLVPVLAALFALATRRLTRESARAHMAAAGPSSPAPRTGPRVFGIDLFGAGQLLLDSGAAMVVAMITLAVLATTLWSRSSFVIQRIVLPDADKTEGMDGMDEELAGSIFATELRRATDVGFSIHSKTVSVRELADVADWTVPGSSLSLRSILSNFVRGERVTIAVAGRALHWKVFVATSSGIAIVVPENVSLSDRLAVAAGALLKEECGGEPSEVLRPACALVLLKLGDQFLDAQLPSAAEETYRRALRLDSAASSASLVHVSLGRLAGSRSTDAATRLASAEVEYQRAERCVAAIPSAPARGKVLLRIHHHWGEAYLTAGRPKEARHHFEQAVAADPTSAYGYHDLGRVALSQGRWDEAERWFSDAIKAEPPLAYSYCDRAEARKRQEPPQLERALEDFRIAARSDVLCGSLGQAAVLGQLGRAKEARQVLRELAESESFLGTRNADPKWIWAYKDLGDLDAGAGARASASRWYEAAERAEATVEWHSATDRREVLRGIYDNWAGVLERGDDRRAIVLGKRGALEPAVGAAAPPGP